MNIFTFTFEELSNQQLYDILRLRQEVFIVEQECAYLDADGLDQKATHVLGVKGSELLAYSRIFAPNIYYKNYSSIGRILTKKTARKKSYGSQIIEFSIKFCFQKYHKDIKIGAQTYLLNYYRSFGFKEIDHPYMEDGIEHQHMILER